MELKTSSPAGTAIPAKLDAGPASGLGEPVATAPHPAVAARPPPASPDVPLSPDGPLSPKEPTVLPAAMVEHQQTVPPALAAATAPPAPLAAAPAPVPTAVQKPAAVALPPVPPLPQAASPAVTAPAQPVAPAPTAAPALQPAALPPSGAPALQPAAALPPQVSAPPAVPVLQPAAPLEAAAAPVAAVAAAPAVPALVPAAPLAAPPVAPPAPAAPAPPPPNPADFEQPELPEEKHPQKPTWRRGYQQYNKTEYIMVTLTPSDCSTKRLRPPRDWYDAFLGANSMNFVVGTQAPDGTAVSFLLKAHAYEYVKAEYYVQGGETKRMFRVLGLQAGDALKLTLQGKSSGIPTTRLAIIPAARNPHAAAILAQAAEQAAKRAERLAANPKGPKGQKKRKKTADDDDDDDEGFEGAPGEGCAAGRRIRQRSKKQFGDDFVSGLDEAWAAAQHSDDDYQPYSDYEGEGGDKRRRRAGSRSAAASSGHAWAASAAAQQQPLQSGSGLAGAGIPEVVATEAADGRNVLRIKINRPGKQGDTGGAAGGSARGRGSDPGCPLNFLAGLADGMGTPVGQPAAGSAAAGAAPDGVGGVAGPRDAPKAEPVVLLSKKLLRDDAGAVTGATCKLGWEKGSRTALAVSRAISQFGVAHADSAAVETFEVQPEQCLVELTLRLQAAAAGRVDVLESALVQLLDAL